MEDKDIENNKQENSKFDTAMTVVLAAVALTAMFMFVRYMVESVSETIQRKKAKSAKEIQIKPKSNTEIKAIDFNKALNNAKMFVLQDSKSIQK